MSFSLHALETALAVYLMKKMLKRELFSLLLQKDLIEHDLVNGEECVMKKKGSQQNVSE